MRFECTHREKKGKKEEKKVIRAAKIYNPEKEFLLRAREWPVRVKNTAWKTHGKGNLATRCELELAAGVCVSKSDHKELGLKHRTNQLLSPNLIMSRWIWAKKKGNFVFCSCSGKIKGTQAFMTLTLTQITALRGQKTEQSHSCCFFGFFLCSEGFCEAFPKPQSWACFCTDNNMPARWTYHRWVWVRPRLDIISERAGGSFVTCLKGDTWKPSLLSTNSSLKTTNSTKQAATQQVWRFNISKRRRITLLIADPLHLCYTAVWVLMWAIMQNEKPNSHTHEDKRK